MSPDSVIDQKLTLKRFRSPKTIISRFIIRYTARGAGLWAIVFGIYVASKAIGFVDIYSTPGARQKIAESFSSNVGIELLLGRAPTNGSTGAYVAWNCLGVMVVIGAIWAFMMATKYLRGEEDNGRSELMLSGQTTLRKSVLNTLSGFAVSLGILYIILSPLLILVGRYKGVDYSTGPALYFTLAVTLGIAIYMMIGALASQFMPTRSKAAAITATVLGASFLLRAISDITSLRWLSVLSPLGWVERLQPLAKSQPLWLIPIIGVILILGYLTIYFAGKRDMGESILADTGTSKPRYKLLNSPIGASLRLSRASILGWLFAILTEASLMGFITKSTSKAFSASKSAEKVLNNLAHQRQAELAVVYLGVIFLIQMILIMSYAAGSISAIRKDEAEGYIDNFLVKPISRSRWLIGRIFVVLLVLVLMGALTTLGVWVGTVDQHIGISLSNLISASANILVPVLFVVGAGVFIYGIRPRMTSLAAYAVLGWSFLVEMVSSGLHINHWVLDTSIMHQIQLAPAANPDWHTNLIIISTSLILCSVGFLALNHRDIELE